MDEKKKTCPISRRWLGTNDHLNKEMFSNMFIASTSDKALGTVSNTNNGISAEKNKT